MLVATQTLIPPTAVTSSVVGSFMPKRGSSQIAVAAYSALTIYEPRDVAVHPLRVCMAVDLAGAIDAMDRLPMGAHHDALVLVFGTRVSVVTVADGEVHALALYQLEHCGGAPIPADRWLRPSLAVDYTRGRIVVLTRGTFLHIINAFEAGHAAVSDGGDGWGDEEVVEGTTNATRTLSFRPPNVVELAALHPSLSTVRDMRLVQDVSTATLVVLGETESVWSGTARRFQAGSSTLTATFLTCTVGWLALEENSAILTSIACGFPYNATTLTPFRTGTPAVWGVLLAAANTLAFVQPSGALGAHFNAYGREEAQGSTNSAVTWATCACDAEIAATLNMAGGAAVAVAHNAVLVSCASGELFNVSVSKGEEYATPTIRVARVSGATPRPPCSTLTVVRTPSATTATVFLGSALGDSTMIELNVTEGFFAISDVLQNFGPVVNMDVVNAMRCDAMPPAMANEASPYDALIHRATLPSLPETTPSVRQHVTELCATVGMGHEGGMRLMRQHIRVDVRHRQRLDCISVFVLSLASPPQQERKRPREEGSGFMLLSAPRSTMVLKLGVSIEQVPSRELAFQTQARTIYAAAREEGMVQVTEIDARICTGPSEVRFVTHVPPSEELTYATMFKNMLLALTVTNKILLLEIHEEGATWVTVAGGIVSFCAVIDVGIIVYDEEGSLRYVALEGGKDQWKFRDFTQPIEKFALERRVDASIPRRDVQLAKVPSALVGATAKAVDICEMLWTSLEGDSYLFIRTTRGELHVYKWHSTDGSLHIRKKYHAFVDHTYVDFRVTEKVATKMQRSSTTDARDIRDATAATRNRTRYLHSFDNISGYSGVAVCGSHPRWFVSHRGQLRMHSQEAETYIRGLAPLHMPPNVVHGFITCGEGQVVVGTIDASTDLTTPWPSRRVHLGETPRFVRHYAGARSVAVVTSTDRPFRPKRADFDVRYECVETEEGSMSTRRPLPNPELPYVDPAEEGVPQPTAPLYSVRLVRLSDGIPCSCVTLQEGEEVLCMDVCAVGEKRTATVIVGTAFPLGETTVCRGRLVALRASAPQNPADLPALTAIRSTPMRGPITAISATVDGHIMVAVGGLLHRMIVDELTASATTVAVLQTHALYITSMVSLGTYTLFADLQQHTSLLRLTKENSLEVAATHVHPTPRESVTLDAISHGRQLAVISSSMDGGVSVVNVSPRHDPDVGATPLMMALTADAKFSAPVSAMLRLGLPQPHGGGVSDVTTVITATTAGSLAVIHPLTESTVRTMRWLGERITSEIEQPAGLHRLVFRAGPHSQQKNARVTDVDGLNVFLLLGMEDRRALAAAAGSSEERIVSVLAAWDNELQRLL